MRESEFVRLEQPLREARQRAREADKKAEQERRRAEEADERTKQERRRAEDEQRNRQEAESRAQIEGKKTRPTTFEEYIRACHTLLSKPLRIQTDKSLSTQGSVTSQEQAFPDPVESLDGLSSTAAAAFRKNLRIYTTRRRTFQLPPSISLSLGRTPATDDWRARRI
jgi:hypothetical protein